MSNLYGTPANAYMVDPSISDQLPSIVKVALSQMNVEKQSMFVEEYKRKRVDLTVIVLLSIFFPIQLFLLGKTALGVVFFFTLGGFGLWYVLEIILAWPRGKKHNEDLASQIMRDMRAMGH